MKKQFLSSLLSLCILLGLLPVPALAAASLDSAYVTPITDAVYTGSAITPDPTVILRDISHDTTLMKNTDYELSYANNLNAGTAELIIQGIGSYSGKIVIYFQIGKAVPDVSSAAAEGTVYTSTPLRSITIRGATHNGAPVDGSFALDPDQILIPGDNLYRFTFTPADTANYSTASGTVSIHVEEPALTSLTISGTPVKRSYIHGDYFDPAGLSVVAAYSDGRQENAINSVIFNRGKPLSAGQTEVSVHFAGQVLTVSGIAVDKKPVPYTPVWSASSRPFNGAQQSVTILDLPEGITADYTGNTAVDAGSYEASALLSLSGQYDPDCYTLAVPGAENGVVRHPWTITRADGDIRPVDLTVQTGAADPQTLDLSQYLPAGCGALTAPVEAVPDGSVVTGAAISGTTLTFSLDPEAAAGQTGTITAVVQTRNYTGITVQITVTVMDKAVPVLSAAPFTRAYNGKAVTVEELTKSALFDGREVPGTWTFADAAPAAVAQSGSYTLLFIPADETSFSACSTEAVITITRAAPTGAPDCAAITASGKRLSDAVLTPGTLSPAGSVSWVLPETTEVQPNTAYQWRFTPADSQNYSELTGQITLYRPVPPASSGGSGSESGESSGNSDRPASSVAVTTGTAAQNGGQVTRTTAAPSAAVTGSSASAALSASAGQQLVEQAANYGSGAVVIAPIIRGSVSAAEVTIPSAAVSGLSSRTDASVVVDTPVAQIAIPNRALAGLSGGDLTVSAQRRGSALSVTVQSGRQTVYDVTGGLTVTAPAPQAASGTVAVLVRSDGSRQVIRKSVVAGGEISIPLEGSAHVELVDNARRFQDVPASSWACGAVAFASSHELFSGTGGDSFSPDAGMTRGMLAVVLHNLESNPSGSGGGFSDISGGAWYASAVSWAAERGIVSGYAGGLFGAEDGVTREQLAAILYRYAGSPSSSAGQTARFTDASSVSGYAKAAMNWAVEKGIINGVGGGALAPQEPATRAQVAQMLKNFLESQI